MKKANSTSFKKGHTRSIESIEKQRQTLIRQFKLGVRKIPKVIWTKNRISNMIKKNRETRLILNPIGSTRIVARRNKKYIIQKVNKTGKWQYQHRIIMSDFIKRPLTKNECVHHKDGNTLNNNIDNLEILNFSKHTKKHHIQNPRPIEFYSRIAQLAAKKLSLNGKWSHKNDSCIICKSNKFKHQAKEMCTSCYAKKYRKTIWH